MRPVTDRFLTTVRGSHKMVSSAWVVAPGQTGVSPTSLLDLSFSAGDVKLDATAQIRGTLDLTVDGQHFPSTPTDPLTPYGNEIFVRRGIEYGDGGQEWVSQGYYRIDDVEQDIAPDGEIKVTGSDRMAGIIDSRPLAPQQFGAGTSVGSIFSFLVGAVYPGVTILFDFDSSITFPASHNLEQDRYAFLDDIVASLGKVWYFDYAGRLVVKTAPDPAVSVFDVTSGKGGVVTKVSKSLSRKQVYNAVVATGQAPGEQAPVMGIALDDDPASPTYISGPFGTVPMFYTSTFLTTNDQCVTAAQAQLARLTGVPYSVSFSAVPNPALEPLDAVNVAFSGLHIIDTLSMSLVAKTAMTATTRAQNFGGV